MGGKAKAGWVERVVCEGVKKIFKYNDNLRTDDDKDNSGFQHIATNKIANSRNIRFHHYSCTHVSPRLPPPRLKRRW